MQKLIVKAAPGIECPREEHPRRYISDANYVEVPASAYYLRRISDGSLVQAPDGTEVSKAPETAAPEATEPAKKSTKKGA